jgi:hypothetical protein
MTDPTFHERKQPVKQVMTFLLHDIQHNLACFPHRQTHALRMKSSIGLPFRFVSRSVLFGMAALGISLVFASRVSAADPGKIVVQVDKTGAKIGPMFSGLMTEEINFFYDGGLDGALTLVNTIAEPMKATPKSSTIDASAKFVREIPGHTVTIIRFSTK